MHPFALFLKLLLTEGCFSSLSLLFFFSFLSTRISREIQSVSQQIQNCFVNPVGISANMKILQKSLGRPLPFKVSILGLQKICVSGTLQIGFNIFTVPASQDSKYTFILCLLD